MKTVFCVVALYACIALAQTETIEQQLAEAEKVYSENQFPKAIEKFQPLLTHFEQAGDRQKTADILFKIGRSLRRTGKFEEARKMLDRAVELHTQLNDKSSLAFDITEIAIAHQRQGHYEEALTLSKKALAIHQELHNFLGIARTGDNIGNIHYRQGALDSAIDAFRWALEAAEKCGDQETLGIILINVGQVHWAKNDFDQALESYRRAELLGSEIHDSNIQATAVANTALIQRDQGDLRSARRNFERVLEIYQKIGNLPLEANTLLNLGSVLFEQGDFYRAIQSIEKCLKTSHELGDQGLESTALMALSEIELDIGSLESANRRIQKTLKISEAIGEKEQVSLALIDRAKIISKMGNDRVALQYFAKAIALDRENNFQRRLHGHLRMMGDLNLKLGNFQRALENYREALSIQQKQGWKVEMGLTYIQIGALHRMNHNYDKASEAINQGLELLQDTGLDDYLWPAYYNKGLISAHAGNIEDSITYMKKAVELIETIRSQVALAEERSLYLQDKLDVYEDLILQFAKSNRTEEAFEYVQRSKSRAFLDSLSEGKIDPQAGIDSAFYDKKQKLLAKIRRLNQSIKDEYLKSTPDVAAIQRYNRLRRETDDQYVELLRDIRTSNPRYASIQEPHIIGLKETQNLLKEDEVLLDYFIGRKKGVVLAVTSGDAVIRVFPDTTKWKEEVQQLLYTIGKHDPALEITEKAHTKYVALASTIFEQSLKPVRAVWDKKTRLIISADGPLSYVPFEALIVQKPPSGMINFVKLAYLIKSHEIQYVPSASVLQALLENAHAKPGGEQKELIAFADPLQKESDVQAEMRGWTSPLSSLPYAKMEVQQIAALYPPDQTTVLIGEEATEAKAKTLSLANFRTIHFASHGLIDEEHPSLSALVLSPGNADEDGFLTMREVFDLKMDADLVVLSACKSGLGKYMRGEGITGLARAFFCAGASNLLVSLWNVSDRSTAKFMTNFYSELKGKSKSAALKAARLKFIQHPQYSHPYYWSAFILVGSG